MAGSLTGVPEESFYASHGRPPQLQVLFRYYDGTVNMFVLRQVDADTDSRSVMHQITSGAPSAISVIGFPGRKGEPADIVVVGNPSDPAGVPLWPVGPAECDIEADNSHAGNMRHMDIRCPQP